MRKWRMKASRRNRGRWMWNFVWQWTVSAANGIGCGVIRVKLKQIKRILFQQLPLAVTVLRRIRLHPLRRMA